MESRRNWLKLRFKNARSQRQYYLRRQLTRYVTLNVPMVKTWRPLQQRFLIGLRSRGL